MGVYYFSLEDYIHSTCQISDVKVRFHCQKQTFTVNI